MRKPGDFRILPEQISREPLAQLVRDTDVDLFNVLRWTIFAMITAEELGVTSANVAEMAKSGNPDVRRLLGVTPGNGKALGLDEAWAYNVDQDRRQLRRGLRAQRRDGKPHQAAARRQRVVVGAAV